MIHSFTSTKGLFEAFNLKALVASSAIDTGAEEVAYRCACAGNHRLAPQFSDFGDSYFASTYKDRRTDWLGNTQHLITIIGSRKEGIPQQTESGAVVVLKVQHLFPV
ncbi:hypothetical protein MUK42_34343 [Musa troglodytarum]|uniref:Uncharacterized protein n=1 Tax=Musa troglodytarum TaxID=320322 RepID=A0A9E7GCI2_9LILI|nr:hypothetical protein MUK42_34343 [Musa troglodytarum]